MLGSSEKHYGKGSQSGWMWFRTIVPYFSLPLIIYTSIIWGIQWYDIALLFTCVFLSGFGFSVGLHRYFTHYSFKTHAIIRGALGIFGLMGSHINIKEYIAVHRAHHAHTDQEGDPHSPNVLPFKSQSTLRALLYAHTGWFFNPNLNLPGLVDKYASDYHDDQLINTLDKLHILIFFMILIIPGFVGAAIEGSAQGFASGVLWGGLFRLFVTDQAECWSRGVSHYFGPADFTTRGSSRNHWIAYISMGEWHNNHHAFPNSAKHGFKWWQIDSGYLLIAGLRTLRLAWDVKSIPEQRILAKRATPSVAVNH